MEAIDTQEVRRSLDALCRALEEERYRHIAGLEPDPALARLFRVHSMAAHKDTVAALRDRGEGELAQRVAALRAERSSAEDEEGWRAAEWQSSARGPDGLLPLAEAERAVVREHDRPRRLGFGQAVAEAISACAELREAALEKRARARTEAGLVPDWEAVIQGDQLLADSDDAYRDVLTWFSRRTLGLAPQPDGDLTRADLLHLLSLEVYSGLFPAGMLALSLRRTCEGLGIELARIRIDDANRPTQWPGAHASGTRVALRRQGGALDWLELFRATGEALAAASSAPHARHEAFATTLGALLQDLLLTPAYLERTLEVERKHLPDLVRVLSLRRLFQLRARAAALRVATEVERGESGQAWRQAHREALSSAALASWPVGLAARDGDAGAHRAFLAGAAWAEELRGRLVERYDEDFWRNPRAPADIAGMLASGQLATERPPLQLAVTSLVRRMSLGR